MRFSSFKYLFVFIVPAIIFFSINESGLWVYSALIFVFILIPLLEFIFVGTSENMTEIEEQLALKNKAYDYIIWSLVPIQVATLCYFLIRVSDPSLYLFEKIGMMTAMGMSCGVLGINAAHELGHRSTKHEQLMSKILLCTTLYMHFFIEHNRGHHKNVATELDPATSRLGENIYFFWFRSVKDSYLGAWQLEGERLKKEGKSFFSLDNEMLRFQFYQLAYLVSVTLIFGVPALFFAIAFAIIGFLLLESVNYIEHYGLKRKLLSNGRYEPVLPHHSWNSDHELGRIFLYELTRHSDHHYKATRKFQVLRHFEESPQLPFGYPLSMIVSLVPPLWFKVMDKRVPV